MSDQSPVFHNLQSSVTLRTHPDGGWQKLDKFVEQHFSRVGERNLRTNRWNIKCRYCEPDVIIEHRELRCTEHLSKYEQCPNAPEVIRKDALQRLATRRGALSSTPADELGTPSNPHVWEMMTTTELPARSRRQQMAPQQSGNGGLWTHLSTAGSRKRRGRKSIQFC